MNKLVHQITLDLEEQTSRVYVSVRKNDTEQVVSIALRAGGKPYELKEITAAVLYMKARAHSAHINQSGTVNGNRVEFNIPATVTAVVDEFNCTMKLTKVGTNLSGTYLHSPPFTINVYDHSAQT